jgi:hypothetical protein
MQTAVNVYITVLELNLIGFNLIWGYEAQNRILGLVEECSHPLIPHKVGACAIGSGLRSFPISGYLHKPTSFVNH